MTERITQCLNKIHEAGLDGVLFAGGANFQYCSECTDYFWQRSCMNNIGGRLSAKILPECLLFMDAQGNRTVICIPRLKDSFAPLKTVVSYMDQMEDTLSQVICGKKIGIGSDCEAFLKDTLKEVDPEIETVDAEHLFNDLRCIKSKEEIEQMRKLAKFTDEAVLYAVNHLKEGMTQFDVEQMLMDYGLEHGIQDFSFPPTAGFKTRLTFTPEENFVFPRTSVLRPQTAIAFDVGYMDKGYCSDWGRTVYFGKAPERIKAGYAALQAGQVKMVSQIVPYKTNVNELYDMVMNEVDRLGFKDVLRFTDRGSLGHQIGIDCHEFPMVNRQTDAILKPGMIFCSEPKMMFDGECYMRVEDMILVTETGAEFLTNFDRNLFEIDPKE